MKQLRKLNFLTNPFNNMIIDLPAPVNLSLFWNFGSMLGLFLSVQLITGVMLTMHYSPSIWLSFSCLSHITRDVNWGWMMRNLHMNGASMFFLCMYLHMGRSLYFSSFKLAHTWNIGMSIYILTMATAFMGYLLPWGQMSFWGATVITNLFSAIPYIGNQVVEWMWGGFGVSNPTLTRFFTLHFLLPFMILLFVMTHLLYLHETGSNNPMGISSHSAKTQFHHMYSVKDSMGFIIMVLIFCYLAIYSPNYLGDPENFIPANPLVTPTHIKPEWYFLWAYAILRSIPNKLGGVVSMFSALLIMYLLPLSPNIPAFSFKKYLLQFIIWNLGATMLLLTWIGGCPVESPYDTMGLILTCYYFILVTSILAL